MSMYVYVYIYVPQFLPCMHMQSFIQTLTQGMAKFCFYGIRDGKAVTPRGSRTIQGMANELPGWSHPPPSPK